MGKEQYYDLNELLQTCGKWFNIKIIHKTKGGDYMYKSLHFESLIHVKDFLNKSNITPDRIIGIYPYPLTFGHIDYEILYISNENHDKTKEK